MDNGDIDYERLHPYQKECLNYLRSSKFIKKFHLFNFYIKKQICLKNSPKDINKESIQWFGELIFN